MKLEITRENSKKKLATFLEIMKKKSKACWLLENIIAKLIGIVLLLSMRACKMQQYGQVQNHKNQTRENETENPYWKTGEIFCSESGVS